MCGLSVYVTPGTGLGSSLGSNAEWCCSPNRVTNLLISLSTLPTTTIPQPDCYSTYVCVLRLEPILTNPSRVYYIDQSVECFALGGFRCVLLRVQFGVLCGSLASDLLLLLCFVVFKEMVGLGLEDWENYSLVPSRWCRSHSSYFRKRVMMPGAALLLMDHAGSRAIPFHSWELEWKFPGRKQHQPVNKPPARLHFQRCCAVLKV